MKQQATILPIERISEIMEKIRYLKCNKNYVLMENTRQFNPINRAELMQEINWLERLLLMARYKDIMVYPAIVFRKRKVKE